MMSQNKLTDEWVLECRIKGVKVSHINTGKRKPEQMLRKKAGKEKRLVVKSLRIHTLMGINSWLFSFHGCSTAEYAMFIIICKNGCGVWLYGCVRQDNRKKNIDNSILKK